MRRRELRDHIFRIVFSQPFHQPGEMPEQMELHFAELPEADEKDLSYIREKAEKVAEKTEEIDAFLNEHTTGWKTTRMNKVDLSILRLAVYEMRYDEDVPVGVAIDEAVELAKKYSGDEGPAFVNGVLAKLAKLDASEV